MAELNKNNKKRRCINCGRAMKQQFIGLQHCKCVASWQNGIGYFEREPNMVFTLERRKKGNKTKQVPVIRIKNDTESNIGAKCETCKCDILKADGCNY